MKIATFNILKGGAKRTHWAKMIDEQSVDLLLLQESYPHDDHLSPLRYSAARGQSVWERVGTKRWGSAVFSRNGSVKPITVPDYSGWVVGAHISGATWQVGFCDSVLAFSVHAPNGTGQYHGQVNGILDRIEKIARGREIINGGDFNLTVSNWCGSERPTCKRDLAIQARLANEFELLNCWQAANPNQLLAQTLRWTGDRTIPYHCDGIFVPAQWRDRL